MNVAVINVWCGVVAGVVEVLRLAFCNEDELFSVLEYRRQDAGLLHVRRGGVWDAKLLIRTFVQNLECCVAQWNAVAPHVGT